MWLVVRPTLYGDKWAKPKALSEEQFKNEWRQVLSFPGLWKVLFDGEYLKLVEIKSWSPAWTQFLIYLKEER